MSICCAAVSWGDAGVVSHGCVRAKMVGIDLSSVRGRMGLGGVKPGECASSALRRSCGRQTATIYCAEGMEMDWATPEVSAHLVADLDALPYASLRIDDNRFPCSS